MTARRRLLALLAPLLVAAAAAVSVTGHAATLGVTSAKLDTFAADQPAPTTTTSTTSQTAPKLIDVTDATISGGDGRFQPGDQLWFDLDQAVDPSTVPDSVTVLLQDPASGNDRLTISGILSATVDLGSDNYLTAESQTATFTASVTLNQSHMQIEVKLEACGGACGTPVLKKGTGTVTFTLATSIEGTNGLSVTGSITKTDFSLF